MKNPWIEAMRLRTLPASCSGVLAGTAVAILSSGFRPLPALLCLLFALLAQIASNFANEYFDYKNGFDKKGRDGFRRGVTEGDISPKAMLRATIITLALACLTGLALIPFGGWWLIIIGLTVALSALAYSAGPYPLSHHGLGDIAVVIFFGIVPVCLTAWLQKPGLATVALASPISIGIGLLAANILIVNNYRDMDDDLTVGKRTTVVIFGKKKMLTVYRLDYLIGTILIWTPVIISSSSFIIRFISGVAGITSLIVFTSVAGKLAIGSGAALNPVLGSTARSLLLSTMLLLAVAILDIFI